MSSLSVVIPVYNEIQTLGKVLNDCVLTLENLKIDYELVVVNDGSTDGSELVYLNFLENKKIIFINQEMNMGYGKAIETGIYAASNEWIVIIPSDDQFLISEFFKIWQQRKKGTIICGSRFNRKDSTQRKLISKLYNIFTRIVFGFNVSDIGWIKLYEQAFIKKIELKTSGFIIDTEIILNAKVRNYEILNVKVEHKERSYGESKINASKYIGIIRDIFTILKLKYESLQMQN